MCEIGWRYLQGTSQARNISIPLYGLAVCASLGGESSLEREHRHALECVVVDLEASGRDPPHSLQNSEITTSESPDGEGDLSLCRSDHVVSGEIRKFFRMEPASSWRSPLHQISEFGSVFVHPRGSVIEPLNPRSSI